MAVYSVADAKNNLPKLIDRALEGEDVVITRHGKPVVELRPASAVAETDVAFTYDQLRALRDSGPTIALTSVELLDQMYEEDDE